MAYFRGGSRHFRKGRGVFFFKEKNGFQNNLFEEKSKDTEV
jgi:hypothetical protein